MMRFEGMTHKSSRAALFGAACIAISLAIAPAAQAQAVAASVDRVFHDYGPAQRSAILHNIWTESRGDPCVVSRTADEGLFQEHGSRRVGLHQFAGVPMGQCVPIVQQVAFARFEWEQKPVAAAAFRRAGSERVAYAIFRGVHAKGLSLVQALRRAGMM
jgi:hypothetical protein